ncbi:MAG: hypothetical protein ABI425_05710 [Patescibacteria group bacterium]
MVEIEEGRDLSPVDPRELFRSSFEKNGFGMVSWANLIYALLVDREILHPELEQPIAVTSGMRFVFRAQVDVTVDVGVDSLIIKSADFGRARDMILRSTYINQLPGRKGLMLKIDPTGVQDEYELHLVETQQRGQSRDKKRRRS